MKKFKKRLPLIAMAMLIVVAMIGGTFAYFTQTSSASNFLQASAYNSELTEVFTPPQDGNFTPGVEVEKDVGVTNTGDVNMLVRIKYEESWDNVPVALIYADPVDGWYDDKDPNAPSLTEPSVVMKKAGVPTNWVYGGDGYYYYLLRLDAGQSTDSFITDIMLKGSTIETITEYVVVFWDAAAEDYTLEATYATEALYEAALAALPANSYISSIVTNEIATYEQLGLYELTFTVETVQAVSEPALIWQTSATVIAVDTFLGNFIEP